ncbi:hypothetical protein B0H14DRAFT_3857457 [Mycena olivaceomarginata]|nr:hypothetical protein B0H14DRAFT_3857457 [Mycena olivaceomarginata]
MPPPNLNPQETARWVALRIVALMQYIVVGVGLYVYPQYCKTDLHTSKNRHKAVLITPRVGRQPHDVPPLFIQPRMSSENGILNTSPLAKLDEEIDADAEGETDDES